MWGVPDAASGLIDAPIGRSIRRPTRMAVRDGGRQARTRYSVERTFTDPEVSLLRCSLETGRTHQIRVHLAAIQHPVVGDPAYGGIRAGLEISRPFLHAATLGFVHPVTGEPQRFASELPPELQRVVGGSTRRRGGWRTATIRSTVRFTTSNVEKMANQRTGVLPES